LITDVIIEFSEFEEVAWELIVELIASETAATEVTFTDEAITVGIKTIVMIANMSAPFFPMFFAFPELVFLMIIFIAPKLPQQIYNLKILFDLYKGVGFGKLQWSSAEACSIPRNRNVSWGIHGN